MERYVASLKHGVETMNAVKDSSKSKQTHHDGFKIVFGDKNVRGTDYPYDDLIMQ